MLIQDEQLRSSINREAFFDQQEWKLYEHVATELRQTTEEYPFQDDDNGLAEKHHSVLAVTCRAGFNSIISLPSTQQLFCFFLLKRVDLVIITGMDFVLFFL
jgi:hypothetical protein